MSDDENSPVLTEAQALRGMQFQPLSPTLWVLRLDTAEGHHWFLVTRKVMRMLADELYSKSEQLQEIQ